MADKISITSSGSPRFDGRTLKWFCGNTFPYSLEVELVNSDTGEAIVPSEYDMIVVRFYDKRDNLIHEFSFDNLSTYEIAGRTYVEVVMNFTEEVTAKFAVGKYTYCVTYYGEYATTIWDNAEAQVEQCH